ncbi:ABC transporter ATP-binding protein [Cupriavidus gilardii]|uniref:ABC transporter ATP-binding protein n=1 Tax=Cupriavidus gilardii TaxID=82541 RepID=UPI001EE6332C|nr:ABC transporter ATP-binding protein [Cupriavidus gilardii]MCG5261378.1 ABC transporter ATP-binding protein [Cupriavidus gilardii]
MSSNELAISVAGVSKRYELYDTPRDRLKQFVMPRLASMVGANAGPYFREFWALRDISFEVRKGEAVSIIGSNGSGKSTLLQIITGTLSPTTGEVRTQGRIAALLELGSGFNPDFTGRENVMLNGAVLGFSNDEILRRFDSIAAFADIGEHIDQPVRTYSSGMLVRLAFAVQVQLSPDILIVDEALAVGDALFQKRCYQQIERLLNDGVTLLFVSHDQETVRTLTNRAVLLNSGRMTAIGNSSEVVLEYRKLLHARESEYYSKIASELKQRATSQAPVSVSAPMPALALAGDDGDPDDASTGATGTSAYAGAQGTPSSMLGRLEFGDGGATVVSTEVLDTHGQPCTVFHPGEKARIRIVFETTQPLEHLNVGVRIRNKEGIKIYSWGTLNQDMRVLAGLEQGKVFWERQFRANERVAVELEFPCALGSNLYEVQSTITYEATPDYMSQRQLHWVDEAAFFQVLVKRDENFFGGIVDLGMRAMF